MRSREAGIGTLIDPGADKPIAEFGFHACVHCGGHFPAPRFGQSPEDKASRVGRGFCMNCNGYICGKDCVDCVPLEVYLENIEKGRDPSFRPIIARTS
jgi:hypothetical protein